MAGTAVQWVLAFSLAVALLALLWAWHTRRQIVRRLASATLRLGGGESVDPVGRGGLEACMTTLERAVGANSLRLSEARVELERLADTFGLLGQGIVICDETGAVVFHTDRARDLVGNRMGEALARDAIDRLLADAMQGAGGTEHLELLGPPRRSLSVTAAPLADSSGRIGAAVVIEDVSERRRLEAIRRDFVANISHELKTPVGALGLLAETLAGEDDHEVTARLVGRMQVEAFRVGRIIEDLLDLSRIEAEESPRRDPVPVQLVLAEAVERVRPMAEHRSVAIQVNEPSRRLSVIGDRRQLVSAVHSLIENAVTYSEAGGKVELDTRTDGVYVEIAVTDHGIGIPARHLERIFERFYRVDRGRGRDTGGTGLGLAIVRHVAGNHGGEVRVQSQEGTGSTFTLKLPAAPGPVVLSAEAG